MKSLLQKDNNHPRNNNPQPLLYSKNKPIHIPNQPQQRLYFRYKSIFS